MKKKIVISFTAALFSVSALGQLPYQNAEFTAEQRADDLIGRLTLKEKVSLMMDRSPAIQRLGIPEFQWWNEALHGVGRNGLSTVYPITMGMAASFDDELLQRIFTDVSDEARAKNTEARRTNTMKRYRGLSFWTPNINIFRDPRWGRGQETYGEDPYLTSRMGLAVVRGLQGPDNTRYAKLLACAKHFAVHSGPEWSRHRFNIEDLPTRDLWETYLPAFKTLVEKGNVAEVMCAYQSIDGEPCCGNSRLLEQILRKEWGFKGLVTSDCGAITDFFSDNGHHFTPTEHEAAAKAVLSGTDVECGSNYKSLPEAVAAGEITEKEIDTHLKRLLTARFRLGDFDPDSLVEWTRIPISVVASKEHHAHALQMARESITLLQNKNNVLPLSTRQSIVVMGPNANDSIMLWGNYSGYPSKTTTILEGIRQKAGNVKYIKGCSLTKSLVSDSRFSYLHTPDDKPGVRGTYWNTPDMKGASVATEIYNRPIQLSNGGNTVFAPGVNLQNFSARYEADIVASADDEITIELACDDGFRVLLDGDTLANVWKSRERIQKWSKVLNLKRGERHRLQVDYFQTEGMATMALDLNHHYQPTPEQLLKETGDAQTVVFVGGISPSLEGEEMKVDEPGFRGGDRTSIELPQVQRDLIALLHKAGKRVVFVNCSGSAVALVPESENADAIVQAWYGGEAAGEAVADVLFGDYNPSGKLPVTFYRSTDQLPDFEDYRMQGRTYRYFRGDALFPFGHGLSYTQFEYGKPQYQNGNVKVRLRNTGKRAGTEVVEVYFRRMDDKEGPIKSLCAFQRVPLDAGQATTVTIPLPKESLQTWDTSSNTMRFVPGNYQIMVGGTSDSKAQKSLSVKLK
ncbi:MAG: xylan 1,4-beta-xylosidase [Prevotella sp.]